SLFTHGKPVVLNFWAGLCPPCRAEMPDLQEVHEEFKDSVLLFGVDVGVFTNLGSQKDARALLEELEVTYPTGAATTNVLRSYRVFSMPTTLFITPQGEINDRWNGLLSGGKLRELVEELLEASGA
ncbi:MAG: TlpA family protein disulfide reductase, partial [Chloroflexi bacterium]|nr:TlpA family protein disulfide reductase [Chloroflexota bacterium]